MAGFGGAIKLTGAESYKDALKQITQNLKVCSAEMKATASSFDAGEASEKDLAKASKELKASLDDQRTALSNAQKQIADAVAEYEKAGKAHQALVKNLEDEKEKLDEIGRTLGTSSKEYEEQEKVVKDLGTEVIKSAKDYEQMGKDVNNAKIQLANAETSINQTSEALDKMGKETEKSSEGFTVMKGVLANLATDVIRSAINGLKELGQAFVDVGKEAMSSYAEYEQLSGGVEKIFGENSARIVEANARRAFATAGMSANEYMETVTNFSASLIAGLEGDTVLASALADTAIQNMADNANTFGTSIQSIQNAYQGFAKGNFTMLDNLKLGYGGTKEEMLRLVKDAGVVGDEIDSINDVSFDQIITAIDIMQTRLNIAGTTANEASTTIQGSTASMKSAWQNLLTGMADENANFSALTRDFMSTLVTEDGQGGILGTIIPRVSTVITGISTAIQTLLPQLIQTIVPIIQQNLPIIIEAISGAIRTVVQMLPQIIQVLVDLIPQIVGVIMDLMPQLTVAGIQIIMALADGIVEAIPQLMAQLPVIIEDMINIFTEWLPDIIDAGINIIMALIEGIIDALPTLIEALPRIITGIVNALLGAIPQIIDAGITLFVSLVQAMPQIINGIVENLPILIEGIITGIMNNLPAIINAGVQLFVALVQNIPAIIKGIVEAIPQIINGIINGITASIPLIQEVGSDLVTSLWTGITEGTAPFWSAVQDFFSITVPDALNGVLSSVLVWKDSIVEYFSAIPQKVSEIINNVVGFLKELPYNLGVIVGDILGLMLKFGNDAVNFFATLPSRIFEWLSLTFANIVQWGLDTMNKAKETGETFVRNIIDFVKDLPTKFGEWLSTTFSKIADFAVDIADKATEGAKNLFDNLINGIKELPKAVMEIGKDIVKGLWEGISQMGDWLYDQVASFADGIVDGMKGALGIASPSKVFRDEVGKDMAQGVGVGFVDEMERVSNQMKESIPTKFDVNTSVNGSSSGFGFESMVSAFKEALSQMKVEMDDEEMGKFVDRTVTELVYS